MRDRFIKLEEDLAKMKKILFKVTNKDILLQVKVIQLNFKFCKKELNQRRSHDLSVRVNRGVRLSS